MDDLIHEKDDNYLEKNKVKDALAEREANLIQNAGEYIRHT